MNEDVISARKLYIDANMIIYFAEADDDKQDKAEALFAYAEENGVPLITSEITIAECLRGVFQEGKTDAEAKYRRLFYEVGFFVLVPVLRETIEESARIGAANRLRLVDAIHVASALSVGCDVFVTNDHGIKSIDGLKVVQLSAL